MGDVGAREDVQVGEGAGGAEGTGVRVGVRRPRMIQEEEEGGTEEGGEGGAEVEGDQRERSGGVRGGNEGGEGETEQAEEGSGGDESEGGGP